MNGRVLNPPVLIPLTFLLTAALLQPARSAEELWLYGRQSDVQYAYDVNIKVKAGAVETVYRGMILYSVDTITDQQIQMTYRGQLQEQSPKPTAVPGRGRGIVLPQAPKLPAFLTGSSITGTSMRTNRITLSRLGEVLTLDGDSQMPYLLGNASLLPFERLPSDDPALQVSKNRSWAIDEAVSITQEKNSTFHSPILRRGTEDKKIQTARSETRYELLELSDQSAKIKRWTRLTSPEVVGERNYEISGEGMWGFDFETGMPISGDFSLVMKLVENHVQVTFPIKISFQRVSAETLQARQAMEKRLAEKQAEEQAERNRLASLPLDAQEKATALRSLQSGNAVEVLRTLQQLSAKPSDPDPQLLVAIRSKLGDTNRAVASAAERLLARWSPEYANWSKINRSYQDGGWGPSSGKTVGPDTQLVAGQLVQFKEHRMTSRWQPAEVVAVLEDATVMLRPRGMRANRPVAIPRDQIELAPDEVDQPGKPGVGNPFATVAQGSSRRPVASRRSAASAARGSELPAAPQADEPRIWSDVTGQHRIEATLLEITDEQVRLKRIDGKEISVPLEKLSQQDRSYVNQQAVGAGPPSDNPFD